MAGIQRLIDYKKMYFRVTRFHDEIEKLTAELYSLPIGNYDREKVDGGEKSDRLLFLIEKRDSCCELFIKELKKLNVEMIEIENIVNRLSFPYCEILMRRYCRFEKFEKIAVDLNYDYRWIRRLHKKALSLFEGL